MSVLLELTRLFNKKIVLIFLLTLAIFTSTGTLAYWSSGIEGTSDSTTYTFQIGTWMTNEYESWVPNTRYYTGDIVEHEGAYYEAIRDSRNWEPGSGWFWWIFWRTVEI